MKLERRDFLKALVASVVVAGSPLPIGLSAAQAKAMIVNDGVTDDTAALQRAIDLLSKRGGGVLTGLNCRITGPVHMRSDVGITRSMFCHTGSGLFFFAGDCERAVVSECYFEAREVGEMMCLANCCATPAMFKRDRGQNISAFNVLAAKP